MKLIKSIFTVCFLVACFLINPAQTSTIDSLKAKLLLIKNDSSKASILFQLTELEGNDEVWPTYNEDLKKIINANQTKKVSSALNKQYQLYKAFTLTNDGYLYRTHGNLVKAINVLEKALKIQEQINDTKHKVSSLENLALIYQSQGELDKALEYFTNCFNIRKSDKDENGMAFSLNNIAQVLDAQTKSDEALEYYLKSLKLFESINNPFGQSMILNNIGGFYENRGNKQKALDYFVKALKYFEASQNQNGLFYALTNIGAIYQKSKEYEQSISYFIKAYQIGLDLKKPEMIRDVSGKLRISYFNLKKFELAFKFYEVYIKMRDSLINEQNLKATLNAQLKYDYDKKEILIKTDFEKKQTEEKLKTEAQKKQKAIISIASLIGLVLLILIITIIFVFLKRSRKDNELISKEKQRSEELLLNILPAEIAEELKATGDAKAKHYNHVSILFTDFKGFTQLSESLTAVELIAELNYCFSTFDTIISNYGLEKIKTIGDAYMAAAGLPIADTEHAVKMVNAAIDICNFMETYKSERIEQSKNYFEVRIGVNSGEVVAGIVGIKKFAYDVWGDTVNTASRMESSGEVGKVNISELTYELVKHQFVCQARGSIEVKGKGKMNMYFVEKIKIIT
jgi:adenylate cyclase